MRKAFSLIELILAIVIVAICTMAIPNMVAQTAESNIFAIKQELILNAKTTMSHVIKTPWDSSYLSQGICADAAAADLATCIASNYSPTPIYRVDNTPFSTRNGIIEDLSNPSSRKFPVDSNGDGTMIPAAKADFGQGRAGHSFGYGGNAANTFNDIDDFDAAQITLNATPGADTTGDFVLNTNINVSVDFANSDPNPSNVQNAENIAATLPDSGTNTTRNIKLVEVRATDTNDPDRFVMLRSYAFNIGSTSVRTRAW